MLSIVEMLFLKLAWRSSTTGIPSARKGNNGPAAIRERNAMGARLQRGLLGCGKKKAARLRAVRRCGGVLFGILAVLVGSRIGAREKDAPEGKEIVSQESPRHVSRIRRDEQVVLFPTYGHLTPGGAAWILPTKTLVNKIQNCSDKSRA